MGTDRTKPRPTDAGDPEGRSTWNGRFADGHHRGHRANDPHTMAERRIADRTRGHAGIAGRGGLLRLADLLAHSSTLIRLSAAHADLFRCLAGRLRRGLLASARWLFRAV